jgi:hypothetical protein
MTIVDLGRAALASSLAAGLVACAEGGESRKREARGAAIAEQKASAAVTHAEPTARGPSSPFERAKPRVDGDSGVLETADASSPADCGALAEAIARRDFVGWRGLNPACRPGHLVKNLPADPERFRRRRLGRDGIDAQTAVVELSGYDRPHVSIRDGAVALFDARPELDAAALLADLGEPDAKLDAYFGTLKKPEGEWVWASRGIAIWKSGDNVFHLALFRPTSVENYEATLSPDLRKRRH